MVILGGLEIVAAGYVINELSKNDKASKRSSSTQPPPHRHRRRKHRDSSPSRPRPSRPSQSSLMPPLPVHPQRPNSAPPQQFGPPRLNSAPVRPQGPPQLGPSWMGPNQPFTQAPQAQTWAQPPQQHQAYHQPAPQQRPTAPNNSAYAGTISSMYFDTKTGKWQNGMLPPEMPRGGSVPGLQNRGFSNSGRHERSQRDRAYSSGSGSYSSDSADSDLAYGSMPGQRAHSHVRERPGVAPPPYSEREHDYYAQEKFNQSQPGLLRENRAVTLSPSALAGAGAPRPGYFELDAETPGRFRPHGKN